MAIVDVLKFQSDASVFAWKYPNSELATWTQLIVSESQEAILMKNGQIADVFGPGRYTLSTDNIPILQKMVNIPFGKKSPFSAEVWYINRAFALDIKWGTPTPIQVQDPKYGLFVPMRAFGQFGIQIEDSRRFLTKLVGTMTFFNSKTLTDYFRGLYITRVKDRLSSCLVKSKISILEINSHLDEISQELETQLRKEYGIYIASFYVNDISVPENDPAVQKLKSALAKRAEMDILGYNYQQERTFDTLNTAAGNQGAAGTVMGAGMGMGMGFGMGGVMGGAMSGMEPVMSTREEQKQCPSCKATIGASVKFCPHCGTNTQNPAPAAPALKCSACGASLNAGVKFCSGCGRKLNPCSNCGSDIPDGQNACPSCGQMLCPNCGKAVASDAKFCLECGHAFVKKCTNCGAELQSGAKFCSQCGTKND